MHDVALGDIAAAQTLSERQQNFVNAAILSDEENISIYTDVSVPYTNKDKDNYLMSLSERKKDVATVKKEIIAKERKFFINKIKRKIGLK